MLRQSGPFRGRTVKISKKTCKTLGARIKRTATRPARRGTAHDPHRKNVSAVRWEEAIGPQLQAEAKPTHESKVPAAKTAGDAGCTFCMALAKKGKYFPFDPGGHGLLEPVCAAATAHPHHANPRGRKGETLEILHPEEEFTSPLQAIATLAGIRFSNLIDLCTRPTAPRLRGRSRLRCMFKVSWFWRRHKAKPPLRAEEWLWACRSKQIDQILLKAHRDRARLILVCPWDQATNGLFKTLAPSARHAGILPGGSFSPGQPSDFGVWVIDNLYARDPPTPIQPVVECMGGGLHRWHRLTALQYNAQIKKHTVSELQWASILTPTQPGCKECDEKLKAANPAEWARRNAFESDVHSRTDNCGFKEKPIIVKNWNTRDPLNLELLAQQISRGVHAQVSRKLKKKIAKNHFSFSSNPAVALTLAKEIGWHAWMPGTREGDLPSNIQVTPRAALKKKPLPETPNVQRFRMLNDPSVDKKSLQAVNLPDRKLKLFLDGHLQIYIQVAKHLKLNRKLMAQGGSPHQLAMMTTDIKTAFMNFKRAKGNHYLAAIRVRAKVLKAVVRALGTEAKLHMSPSQLDYLAKAPDDEWIFGGLGMLDNGYCCNPSGFCILPNDLRESMDRSLDEVRKNVWQHLGVKKSDHENSTKIYMDDLFDVHLQPEAVAVNKQILAHCVECGIRLAKTQIGQDLHVLGGGIDVTQVGTTNRASVYYPDDKRRATRSQLLDLAKSKTNSALDWEKAAHKVQHSLGFTAAQPEELRGMMFHNVAMRLRTMANSKGRILRPTPIQWQKKSKLKPARSFLALHLLAQAYNDPTPSEGQVWRSDLEHLLAVKHEHSDLRPKEIWELTYDTSQGRSREAPTICWPTVGFTWERTDEGASPTDAWWGSESLGNLAYLLSFRNERHSSEALESCGKLVCVAALARARNLTGCLIRIKGDNKGSMDGKAHELVTFTMEGLLNGLAMRKGFALRESHLPREQLMLQDGLSKGIMPTSGLKGHRMTNLGAVKISKQVDALMRLVAQWAPANSVMLQPRYRFLRLKNRPPGWERVSHSQDLERFLNLLCPHNTIGKLALTARPATNSGGANADESHAVSAPIFEEARLAHLGDGDFRKRASSRHH